jgi:hypothetical protein
LSIVSGREVAWDGARPNSPNSHTSPVHPSLHVAMVPPMGGNGEAGERDAGGERGAGGDGRIRPPTPGGIAGGVVAAGGGGERPPGPPVATAPSPGPDPDEGDAAGGQAGRPQGHPGDAYPRDDPPPAGHPTAQDTQDTQATARPATWKSAWRQARTRAQRTGDVAGLRAIALAAIAILDGADGGPGGPGGPGGAAGEREDFLYEVVGPAIRMYADAAGHPGDAPAFVVGGGDGKDGSDGGRVMFLWLDGDGLVRVPMTAGMLGQGR